MILVGTPDWWWHLALLVQGLAWGAAALSIHRSARRPLPDGDRWIPAALAVAAAGLLLGAVPLAGVAGRLAGDAAWLVTAVALPVGLVAYPHGRPRSRLDRLTAGLLVVLAVAGLDPGGLVRAAPVGTVDLRVAVAVAQLAVLLAAFWLRGERALDRETGIAMLWPALGLGASALLAGHLLFAVEGTPLPASVLDATFLLLSLALPASVAVGLVTPRVRDVRRLVSGVAVAVVMGDLTVGVVTGLLSGWTWLVGAPSKVGTAVAATTCAVAFGPVLVRVRRIVEEVLFGGTSDPLEAMARLGAELGADSSPQAWVEALQVGLLVPRVELRAGGALLGAAGAPGGVTDATPLLAGGEVVGELVVTLPPEATRLPRATRLVLDVVAAPLARALQAVRLADALHASRERVVLAREEERRRLRRDLHDGLGPVLTGVAYTADAATNVLRTDTERASLLLAQLREDTTDAIEEVRRIVAGLRPPALDEVGLVGALRQHVLHHGGHVRVDVRSSVPAADVAGGLPAAVEVVAYRVAVEALTNVARHARPVGDGVLTAVVRLDAADGQLVVAVDDDGRPGAAWAAGTGLTSMRERCDEVGGSVAAGPTRDGGNVLARIPLAAIA